MASAPPAWPTFDVAEIAQEASERAGIEFRSGYALRTARRALELLTIEWANRGLNLWTIQGGVVVDLVPGQYIYQMPDDTVDLVDFVVRTWNPGYTPSKAYAMGLSAGVAPAKYWSGDYGAVSYNPELSSSSGPYTDLTIDRMTQPEYAAVPNKLATGRPTVINVRRQIHPYFILWPVPPDTPFYQIVLWRLRRIQAMPPVGAGEPDIPWRFIPAIIAGLAYYMSLKTTDPKSVPRVAMLKAFYEEQYQLAADEDRDRASFHFVPFEYWP